ncbi:hypothetical protein SNE40_018628 [Patella caerulea]|uniref:Uncharacterized protein n=2 Tax=Patella caerulea TaxID=87958 RepID=A0AAN8J7X3_PATCE
MDQKKCSAWILCCLCLCTQVLSSTTPMAVTDYTSTVPGVTGTGSPPQGMTGTGSPPQGMTGTGSPPQGMTGTGIPPQGMTGTGGSPPTRQPQDPGMTGTGQTQLPGGTGTGKSQFTGATGTGGITQSTPLNGNDTTGANNNGNRLSGKDSIWIFSIIVCVYVMLVERIR